MLCQLRNYIQKQQTASIVQISREFRIDIQALKPMLEIWVKKGVFTKHMHPLACKSSCNVCNVDDITYYCWVQDGS